MTSTSKNTYREVAFPLFREVFIAIDKVCQVLGIDYYLIGAQARDFHLLEKGIKPNRGTKDVDFAVMLPEMKTYEKLISLLEQEGFRKVTESYRMIYSKTNTVMDILPYGEIEEEGTVKFTERETELSVVGLKEVGDNLVNVDLGELSIKVSPIEGIVILKLVSYSERNDRKKDLDDIHNILEKYDELNGDRFYNELIDVEDEFSPYSYIHLSSARLLGRDMGSILSKSEKLSALITGTLRKELGKDAGTITEYFLTKGYFGDYEIIRNVFEQILKGIEEKRIV